MGLPVEPEVYRMNSGSSASIHTGSHSGEAVAISSCHQKSRPGSMTHLVPGPLDHDDALDGGAPLQGHVGVLLQRDELAAAVVAVGGDEHLAVAVVDPVPERLGAESAEHDAVHRPDAGAGQHGDGQLRDHRHVDGDAVALLHALGLEHVGELADLMECSCW